MSLPLILMCSGLLLSPPLSAPHAYTAKTGVNERGASVHKVQRLTTEEMQKHFARDTISGRNFRAIEAAIPELERRQLKVEDYHIVVFRLDTSLHVMFVNPEYISTRPPPKDCPGSRPCLNVELNFDDLRVIGSTVY